MGKTWKLYDVGLTNLWSRDSLRDMRIRHGSNVRLMSDSRTSVISKAEHKAQAIFSSIRFGGFSRK